MLISETLRNPTSVAALMIESILIITFSAWAAFFAFSPSLSRALTFGSWTGLSASVSFEFACLFSASSLTIFNDCFCFIFSFKSENLFFVFSPISGVFTLAASDTFSLPNNSSNIFLSSGVSVVPVRLL